MQEANFISLNIISQTVILYTLVCKSADSGPESKDSKVNESKGISGLLNMAYLQ
jgi:hypothetical protein